ncbi:hypothetical protein ABMA28_003534 [Loxostege sticticalis]|uniref:Transposase n=1 Tax=Loxostege sticticalis TaxID=481309 RepID=A0ABD0SWE8_LOXSC
MSTMDVFITTNKLLHFYNTNALATSLVSKQLCTDTRAADTTPSAPPPARLPPPLCTNSSNDETLIRKTSNYSINFKKMKNSNIQLIRNILDCQTMEGIKTKIRGNKKVLWYHRYSTAHYTLPVILLGLSELYCKASNVKPMAQVKQQATLLRKRVQALRPEQRQRLAQMKEKKETARFLMPDAPERKYRKRNASPPRISCPLVPGTPPTPPPKVPRYWERTVLPSGNAQSDVTGMESMDGLQLVDANIELIGFSPNPTDDCDVDTHRTAGSDLEEDHPDLPEDAGNQDIIINNLDAQNDIALQRLLTGDDLFFDWSCEPSSFLGERETFTGTPGPTFSMSDVDSPLDVFRKFFDDELMGLIVTQTNHYANIFLASTELKSQARMQKWQPVSMEEMWIFLAILMWQGLNPMPCQINNFYFYFYFYFYNRFLLIKKCLHFSDNEQMSQSADPDQKKLFKIKPVLDHLEKKFSELYYPRQEIALDESLLLWKDRLTLAQKIATKAAEVGLKTFELCESKTGYLYSFIVYTGKSASHTAQHGDMNAQQSEEHPDGATAKIVFDLVRPLFFKGHTLVMDNFYNSPLLSRALKKNCTDTMGTLRLNRQFVPDIGEVAFSHTKDDTVVVWRDSNLVSLISSYHKGEVGGKAKYGNYKYRPQIVLDYNLAMGGVDKKNQLLSAFPIERCRNLIWYKKLFRRLLNVTIPNSHIIFGHKKNMTARAFRVQLLDNIFQKFKPPKPLPPLEEQHFLERGTTSRARCRWCTKNGKLVRTTWQCDTCKVPLCVEVCFKAFHAY